jgi:SAM-dependent methyltransferase
MTGTETWQVDPTNVEQAAAWDGDEGAYWAANADLFEGGTAEYDERLLDAADIREADRVLDVGCGTGDTARAAARRASKGSVIGVDLSREMLGVARDRTERAGIDNLSFEQADVQVYPFEPDGFDAAISKTGTMFFGDPVAAFGNIALALRPGGRLAMLVWRSVSDNEWFREIVTAFAAGRDLPAPPPDAPGPFALADPERIRRVLPAAGFGDVKVESVAKPMRFGADAAQGYEFIAGLLGWMLDDLDESGRARARESLRATMAAHETDEGVRFESAMWLATAVRP